MEFSLKNTLYISGLDLFVPVESARFIRTTPRFFHKEAAQEIGLSSLDLNQQTNHFAHFLHLDDRQHPPLALKYHGHQFRHYNPQLGDGRGFLWAQCLDQNQRLMDLGTKGSGTTPYSRKGDGRLTLKGGLREILASSLLAHRGVNVSRSLALVETHENLVRFDEPSPTRSGVLTRLSHSHIRIGSFERLAYENDFDTMIGLVKYCHEHLFHQPIGLSHQELVGRFFDQVCERTSAALGQMMAAGFVHGVLNTDNINITGEVFDFGPYRFLPEWDETFTAAYFDETGLYAFGRQPEAYLWNLSSLAQCLSHFDDKNQLLTILNDFYPRFHKAFHLALLHRLGLRPNCDETDKVALKHILEALTALKGNGSFDALFSAIRGRTEGLKEARFGPWGDYFTSNAALGLSNLWQSHEDIDLNPQAPSPRLLIEDIEAIWEGINIRDDWSFMEEALESMKGLETPMDPLKSVTCR
jgi:serine/tyrosine/threonine adenylyltransferase